MRLHCAKSFQTIPSSCPVIKHNTPSTRQASFDSPKYSKPLFDPSRPVPLTVVDPAVKLGRRWMEYQGATDWAGLLDPLDDNLRAEILRYGFFVEAAYRAFEFDPSSSEFGSCRFNKRSLLSESGFPNTGYRVARDLRATSGIVPPQWADRAPGQAATRSSWIGYVAVCQDKQEIARIGRRDVVIAFRGTATCLEWVENLRASLTRLPDEPDSDAAVESGFLSLYTSGTGARPSLRDTLRREIGRILKTYPDEELSFTITGHSLGAALATLAAYDIKETFKRAPLVTVISFGGPRVGNRTFRSRLEKQGTKILRIVNPDDLITKVPGFVIENNESNWSEWIQRRVEDTQWVYAEVGCELRLTSRDESPVFMNMNFAKCHDLKTYLKLVEGFVESNCPLRATARRLLDQRRQHRRSTVVI